MKQTGRTEYSKDISSFFLAKTSNKLPQLDKQLEINRDLLTKINVVNV